MYSIHKSVDAEEDLTNIWLYTVQEWGALQADDYLDQLEYGILQLQENPKLGRPRDDVRAGYRSLSVNQHMIYYNISQSTIHIVRVLHGKMDPDRHV